MTEPTAPSPDAPEPPAIEPPATIGGFGPTNHEYIEHDDRNEYEDDSRYEDIDEAVSTSRRLEDLYGGFDPARSPAPIPELPPTPPVHLQVARGFEAPPIAETPVPGQLARWEHGSRPRTNGPSGLKVAVLGGLLGAVATFAVLLFAGALDRPVQVIETVRTEIATPTEVESTIAAAIAGKVTPAIVTVRLAGGSGSGVIYDQDEGYVITNEHVVDGALTVEVVLADGRTYQGRILGTDTLTDLAVIDIDAGGLTQVEIGETDSVVVGDPAYAIGNPLALIGTPTVTEGIISALDRRVEGATEAETLYGMLQTDAPFTRGSSGGSLVDRDGRLIGITTAVAVSDIGAEGLGFATPVEIVQRVVDEIIATGSSTHGFLGINGGTKFRATQDQGQRPIGVEVVEILSPSAAGAAGLEAGDVITTVDGHPVDTMQELISRLRRYSADQTVTIDYLRNGETDSSLDVTLGNRS